MDDFPDTWKCFTCGEGGHMAATCPQTAPENAPASERPKWCGECDRDTRLIDHGDYAQRCYRCWVWPAKGTRFHQLLPQHRLCGGCRNVIYEFDKMPCGKHQPLGIDADGHRAEVTVAELEDNLLPLVNEPGELAKMSIRQLGAELARLREPQLPPGPMTPEREAALRALALRQIAPYRNSAPGMLT